MLALSEIKMCAALSVMLHACWSLTWTGGDPRSVPAADGGVSSVGPRGKWHSLRA